MKEIDASEAGEFFGHGKFRTKIPSDIFVLRKAEPITEFRAFLLDSFRAATNADWAEKIERFLTRGDLAPEEVFARFVRHIEWFRDSRAGSKIFAGLVASVVGSELDTLIDTGHIRIVVPPDYAERIRSSPALRSHFYGPRDRHDYEVSVVSGGARAHRDIQAPHFTTQANFWFPLHRLEARESLTMFPDVARLPAQSYSAELDHSPENWGFGTPSQVALEFGDALLFNSEHLHASPNTPEARPRITVELRIVAGAVDDNAVYRRLFWNLKNLLPDGGNRRAIDLYNQLFADARSARLASETLTSPQEIVAAVKSPSEAASLARELAARDLGPDLRFFCAKLFIGLGEFDEAWAQIEQLYDPPGTYAWALDGARIAAENGNNDLARKGIESARRLASTLKVEPQSLGAPDLNRAPFQMLPSQALRACDAMMAALHMPAAQRLLHYRFFHPQVEMVASDEYAAIYRFGVLYASVPHFRDLDPAGLMADCYGVIVGGSHGAVADAARERRSQRSPGDKVAALQSRLRNREDWERHQPRANPAAPTSQGIAARVRAALEAGLRWKSA